MNANIWNHTDYKKFIKSIFHSKMAERGFISRLAEAGGCQPSYLSQVLNSKAQLTPDQACGMAVYLNLSEHETEYFIATVELARAVSPLLKKRLSIKLEALKSQANVVGERLKRATWQDNEFQALYYSSWSWIALHILVSIPEFRSVEAISKRLSLKPNVVSEQLIKLEEMGFVERKMGQWHHAGGEIHLPSNSPLISLHHNNWRARGVLDSQSPKTSSDHIHFSGVYAVSKTDIENIRSVVLKMIEDANQIAGPSPSEDLAVLTCDFFRA